MSKGEEKETLLSVDTAHSARSPCSAPPYPVCHLIMATRARTLLLPLLEPIFAHFNNVARVCVYVSECVCVHV